MSRKEHVLKKLLEYTEDEEIYRRYYELRDDDTARHEFLASVEAYAQDHHLFIEEYPFITIPTLFSERNISPLLGITEKENVFLMKHARYTPVFVHQQDFFEAIYILRGACRQMIDGEEVPLRRGDLCFIPPFVEHTLEIFDDSIAINLQIRRDTFDDIFFNTLRSNSILAMFFMSCLYSKSPTKKIVFSTGEDEEIENLILEMYEEILFRDEYSPRLLSSMTSLLFVKTLRGYSDTAILKSNTPEQRTSKRALRLIAYINDHYQDITLEELADHFHYSAPYCSKLIRNETGMGFVFFVSHVRMNRAAILLQNTNNTIVNIANMVGYENTESFIRAFQKVYKMSPGNYRKSIVPT